MQCFCVWQHEKGHRSAQWNILSEWWGKLWISAYQALLDVELKGKKRVVALQMPDKVVKRRLVVNINDKLLQRWITLSLKAKVPTQARSIGRHDEISIQTRLYQGQRSIVLSRSVYLHWLSNRSLQVFANISVLGLYAKRHHRKYNQ